MLNEGFAHGTMALSHRVGPGGRQGTAAILCRHWCHMIDRSMQCGRRKEKREIYALWAAAL